MKNVCIRDAQPSESAVVGALHAASWKIAYRGLLSDAYLDNDLDGERIRYWEKKMTSLKSNEFVMVADTDSGIVGFIAVMDIPDMGYSALVDNLHVVPELKGMGIGAKLMRAAANRLLKSGRSNFYLWVLEGNIAAEKFYEARFGRRLDRNESEFGGKMVWATRYVWDDFDQLLSQA